MNKRARYARRIIKDHAGRGRFHGNAHWSVVRVDALGKTTGNWYCPHCRIIGEVKKHPERNRQHIPIYYGGEREQARSSR